MKAYGTGRILDLLIVGTGPAGLAALHAAKTKGLDAAGMDKGPVASALASHPTYMRWFSTSDKLELAGFPLLANEKNPTRREYLKYCRSFVQYFDLPVITYQKVTTIRKTGGVFKLDTADLFGRAQTWQARNVIAASGFYDNPRQLNIPGEDLPKVTHRYTEAHWYADHDVLVIGGGSSAAEVALELYRAGASVAVAMRERRFQTKYWVEPDIENRIAEGAITCYRETRVCEVRPDEVVFEQNGREFTAPNDFVLAMVGYEPDTSLIEAAGAQIDKATGKPVLTEAFESTVPGLYVAGTLCAGQEANVVFVENGREHGPRIVEDITAKKA